MNLRLNSKMRAGFGAMSALLLVGGLVTVMYTYRMQSATANLLAHNFRSLEAAESLELTVERMRDTTAEELLGHDPRWRAYLGDRRDEFRRTLEKAQSTARAPQQSEVLRALAARFATYEWDVEKARDRAPSESTGTAAASPLARAQAILDGMYALCEKLESVNEQLTLADLAGMERSNRTLRIAMYGLGASGILLGYFLALVISRSITQPIVELVLKVRGAAGHEVVERVDVRRGAELEELDGHIRQLIERSNTTRADLDKSRRLLARSEKLAALGRISAGVAHEIRNPLTSIKMLIYSLTADTTLPEDQQRDLAVMAKEIERMDRFVENFLKFAKPPAPAPVPADLNQIVRETLEFLASRLRGSNTGLIEDYQTDIGTIEADPDQLRQVVMNLVLNALEAMPDGGSLAVETRRSPPQDGSDRSWVQLRVRDSGGGIPEELLDRLFDPFVSGREDGCGLGLAISYQIVQQHGGWIDAVNEPGGGTTVIVNLPDRRGQDHAQGASGGRRGERPLLVPKNAA
jgi:signal transduction histidine kinase